MKLKSATLDRATGQGRPYAAADRARVLTYAVERQAAGAGLARIAREVGVAPNTLAKWLRPAPFVPVEVISVDRGTHVVQGPRGIRIEGLSLSEIAELIRSLG